MPRGGEKEVDVLTDERHRCTLELRVVVEPVGRSCDAAYKVVSDKNCRSSRPHGGNSVCGRATLTSQGN